MKGLEPHDRGLVERFLAGITKRVPHHLGQPTAESAQGSCGMGHGEGEETTSMIN
ncbi:MAG: hypothetical protein ACK41W_11650 [Cyanobacteriota bacterium]|jgi:hypothetical protein